MANRQKTTQIVSRDPDRHASQPARGRQKLRAPRIAFLSTFVTGIGLWTSGCAGPRWLDTHDPSPPPAVGAKPHWPEKAEVRVEKRPADVKLAAYAEPVALPDEVESAAAGIVGDEVTFEEAIEHTLANHPTLRALRHEVEAAEGILVQASLVPNPQLVLDADTPLVGRRNTDLSGRIDFTFQLGHKRERNMALAQAGIRRAQGTLQAETLVILTETADAALEVLYLQELDELQGYVSGLADAAAEIQTNKSRSGVISDVESLVAEVDAADIAFDRIKGESELELAKMRLAKAIGMSPPRPISVSGRIVARPAPKVPLETVLASARLARPDIKEAEATLTEAARQLDVSRGEAIPDLQLGPRWQDRIGTGDGDTLGGRISFDVPVFDRKQGEICESAALVRARRADLEATEINSLADVAAAYRQMPPVEKSLEFFEKRVLPLTSRAEQAVRASEEAQAIDPFQTSNNLRRLGRLRVSHLELRYLHAQLRTHLELFLGQRLESLEVAEEVAVPEPEKPAPKPRGADGARNGRTNGRRILSSADRPVKTDAPVNVPPRQLPATAREEAEELVSRPHAARSAASRVTHLRPTAASPPSGASMNP